MLDPRVIEIAKLHRNELLQEASVERILQDSLANQSSLSRRLLLRLGDLLVAVGMTLQRRYSTAERSAWMVEGRMERAL